MDFCFGNLTFEQVRSFLGETDKEFEHPLSEKVDIEEYALKLSQYSSFSYCVEQGEMIGMISCYTNRPPVGYISNVCVKYQYHGLGVFNSMFERLKEECVNLGINIIRLEVDNDNYVAQLVYLKNGFCAVGNGKVRSKYMECLL